MGLFATVARDGIPGRNAPAAKSARSGNGRAASQHSGCRYYSCVAGCGRVAVRLGDNQPCTCAADGVVLPSRHHDGLAGERAGHSDCFGAFAQRRSGRDALLHLALACVSAGEGCRIRHGYDDGYDPPHRPLSHLRSACPHAHSCDIDICRLNVRDGARAGAATTFSGLGSRRFACVGGVDRPIPA